MSRTSKCRPSAGNSLNAADPGTTAASPDEGLLVQLNSLCEQRLDARYRRKLEAVTLLWQRHEKGLIEERAQASLRTVQRWADSVRRLGPEALHGRRRAPASKLNAEQRERLAADLKVGPSAFGYVQGGWSAALLMRHVRQSYGVRFTLRHCRRLLSALGLAKTRAVQRSARERLDREIADADRRPSLLAPPVSDYQRKHRALIRIKRLASSGMSIRPFAYTLFDLVRDAVPYDETSPGLAAVSSNGPRWIIRDFDYPRWYALMQKYLFEAGPERSGIYSPSALPRIRRTVLRHEQIARPDYYRSEGYNEFFRHLGMHHGLLTILRDEQGGFIGYYPVFRSDSMKPFSSDDMAFFKAAAAHIAHGVGIADAISPEPADGSRFEPFQQLSQGVVVMDRAGKVLSLNRAAHSLFFELRALRRFGREGLYRRQTRRGFELHRAPTADNFRQL